MSIIGIILTLLVLAVLLWGGDKLLAVFPGNGRVKQVIRIVVIVFAALLALSLVASLFGVSLPWNLTLRR